MIFLILGALGIYFQALSFDDVLLSLMAGVLFFWLGSPWKRLKPGLIRFQIVGGLVYFLGCALDSLFVMTCGWVIFFFSVFESQSMRHGRLACLLFFAFPWVSYDATHLGWWFRLGGAFCVAHILRVFGIVANVQGTQIMVENVHISVEPACSGLHTLHALFLFSILVLVRCLPKSRLFWLNLPLIVFYAFCANTLRILLLSLCAYFFGPTLGLFHSVLGFLILCAVFVSIFFIVRMQSEVSYEASEC